MKTIGMYQLTQKVFKLLEFTGRWQESFGKPEFNFSAIIYGESGHGKTDFCVKFAKYLSSFTKVLYFSREEGISATIQEAFARNNMQEVSGKVILASDATFEDLMKYLKKRNSPGCVILDSADYMDLTSKQFKELVDAFPKKSFVVISWSDGKHPKTQAAKDIQYMCDMKIFVNNYRAYPRSRFGGNKPFVIWDKAAEIPPAVETAPANQTKTEQA